MDEDTCSYLEGMRQELSEVRTEISGFRAEMREEIRASAAETRRHFDITAEALRHDLGIVAEGVAANTEALGRLRADMQDGFHAVDRRFLAVARDLAAIRGDIA